MDTNLTASTSNKRRQLRISLSSAFLWLTLLTLLASHAWTLVQLYNANEERRLLYQRFGIATVYDPDKVSSAATWYSNERRCRIQVYLPPDRHLVLKYKIQNASSFDYREPQGEIDLDWVSQTLLSDQERRFLVDVVTHRIENGGQTKIVVMAGDDSRTYIVDVSEGHILDLIAKGKAHEYSHGIANSYHMGDMPDVPRTIYQLHDSEWNGLLVWLDNATEDQ